MWGLKKANAPERNALSLLPKNKEVVSFMRHILLLGFIVMVVFLVIPRQAHAIPPFARQYGLACSTCHSPAPPRLNDFGRNFKEAGYYQEGGNFTSPNDMLTLPELPPVSLRVLSWVVENQKSQPKNKRTRFTIPDEYEVNFASALGPIFSFFGEVEFEGGASATGSTYLDYHTPGWLSLRAGNFAPDDWLAAKLGSGHFRLTRQRYLFEDHSYVGAQNLGVDTPGLMLYGRPSEPFWFDIAVVEGDTNNAHKDFWAHINYLLAPTFDLGLFGYWGKWGSPSEDFSRFGASVKVPLDSITFTGVWSAESYQNAGTNSSDAEFNTGHIGLTYPFNSRTYADARWEFINSDNVSPEVDANFTTFHVGYLIRENVRTALEYTVDSEESDNNRFTWMLDVIL